MSSIGGAVGPGPTSFFVVVVFRVVVVLTVVVVDSIVVVALQYLSHVGHQPTSQPFRQFS